MSEADTVEAGSAQQRPAAHQTTLGGGVTCARRGSGRARSKAAAVAFWSPAGRRGSRAGVDKRPQQQRASAISIRSPFFHEKQPRETGHSKQQTANSKQQTANGKRQTANGKRQTADSRQQTAYRRLVDVEAKAAHDEPRSHCCS
ncbi:hypothetical protein BCR34DRAFT_584204 [Clohesyomyces aquaticus]|uniref:Uncharacterized protein n=1 Tax=Clohesyomyces aquaticus TaxID=1231657 RepID=A0A1Y2A1Z7_9PLEO|nr:hypothetical protein BCR34DRAFT_584204 [Clohesyomyces aquaticus]